MKNLLLGLLALACSASPGLAAGLQLSIRDGKVSIDAQDVTVRQILTEWARVGKTRIVNLERVSGGPVTIKFEGLPEKQALDIVLRTVPGFMAAAREAPLANASVYDTILVMATTTTVAALPPARTGGATAGGPFGGNTLTQLRQAQMPPAMMMEPPDPAADQLDDPAIAAAAAAGLIPVPAAMLPGAAGSVPMGVLQGGGPRPEPASTTPPVPTNPWNAQPGTAQPSLPAPPPPVSAPPAVGPRPPLADQ